MKEFLVVGDTLPSAYHKALKELELEGSIEDCSDWNTRQKEVSMTMIVTNPIQEPMISLLFIGGPKELEQYRQEMLYGILDFEVDKGNLTYTYHKRMGEQIDFVVEELKRSPSSRRAVIDIRDKVDMDSEEPACLQHIQYFIRDNKLECKVLFRSNDACKATFMNAFALILLQKSIADKLGIEVGSYTHRANSFHCYEKDFRILNNYTKRIMKYKYIYNNAVDYIGDWDEMMEECKPEIAKQIEELKSH